LANLEEDEKESFFNSVKIERLTPKTICEPDQLRKHLKQIQEQGYSIDDGENEEEVRCVAAPIFDNKGKILASISIAGPIYRMSHKKIDSEFISAIKKAAKNISMRIA
jgi:DNA-binding IclR family transcriptional regulator